MFGIFLCLSMSTPRAGLSLIQQRVKAHGLPAGRQCSELEFGLGIGRSAHSGKPCKAGRPIATAQRGVFNRSGSMHSTTCDRSDRRGHASIGCEIVRRILAHVPAEAALRAATRASGRSGGAWRPVRRSGGRGKPRVTPAATAPAGWRLPWKRTSRRRGLGAPGRPASRTARASRYPAPTVYCPGTPECRRTISTAPSRASGPNYSGRPPGGQARRRCMRLIRPAGAMRGTRQRKRRSHA